MPFAVTLMAKLGLEGQSTAKDLLENWLESGPYIFSDPEQSMNRSIGLSVESDLVKRNPNAITLPAILPLLPAGATKENLRWWDLALKKSMIPSAMATLSQAALVVENKREFPLLQISSWFPSSIRLCSSKTESQRRSGSRYIRRAVNSF